MLFTGQELNFFQPRDKENSCWKAGVSDWFGVYRVSTGRLCLPWGHKCQMEGGVLAVVTQELGQLRR